MILISGGQQQTKFTYTRYQSKVSEYLYFTWVLFRVKILLLLLQYINLDLSTPLQLYVSSM